MSRWPGEMFKKIFFALIVLCKFEHRKLDISKSITDRSFKLRHLIEYNKEVTWEKSKKELFYCFRFIALYSDLVIKNL